MNIDQLKELPAETLQDLIANAQKLLNKYEEDRKKQVIKKIQDLAASEGLSVDIFDDKSAKKTKGVAKYRNPDNPKQTWTGRGKRPGWLVEKVDAGVKLDDMAI